MVLPYIVLRCDNCLIATMLVMQQIACILRCVAMITGSDELQGIADIMTLIADLLYCSVCACMQTQHKMEMDVRDGKLAPKVRPLVEMPERVNTPVSPIVGDGAK